MASVKSAGAALKTPSSRFDKKHPARERRKNTFLSPAARDPHGERGSTREPPGRDTPLCAVENSPQVCCQTRTCSEKARIYVGQLLSRAPLCLLALYFSFFISASASRGRRVVTLHAGQLLVIAMHNIRNFSSDEIITNLYGNSKFSW